MLPTVMFFIYSWQYSKSAFLVLPLSLSKMRKFLPNCCAKYFYSSGMYIPVFFSRKFKSGIIYYCI